MFTHVQERQVTRPTVTPLRSTVLDHATVVETSDHFDLVNEGGLWPSYNCLDTLTPTALCPDPTEDKEFAFIGWIPAFSFAVYAGVQCNLVGLDTEDQKKETKRVFMANEGLGVERALLANRFIERDAADNTGNQIHRLAEWDAPVDLTTAITLSDPKIAFSVLEGYARTIYSGQPTLHLPAGAVSLLGSDKIIWEGDKAYTRLGSKVALGGGYDPDYVGWDGSWDFYATGEVYVEKGAEVDIQQYELNGSAAQSAAGIGPNTGLTLVERPYRLAVDCFTAKVSTSLALPEAPVLP
jgi:hypothetical protein